MLAVVIRGAGDLAIEGQETGDPDWGQVVVRVEAGGIGGTESFLYQNGISGPSGCVRMESLIPGHEVAGRIARIGPGVTGLRVGDLVAVDPRVPCGACRCCRSGSPDLCLSPRILGTLMARRTPVQGAFRDEFLCAALQCVPAAFMDASALALSNPMATALRALSGAGELEGRRLLVMGDSTPAALAVAASRLHGVTSVAAASTEPQSLAVAARLGADHTVDIERRPGALARPENRADVTLFFGASPERAALREAMLVDAVAPGGIVVLANAARLSIKTQKLFAARGIILRDAPQSDGQSKAFREAVSLIDSRHVQLDTLIERHYPMRDTRTAFEHATTHRGATKIQIAF
ncbi:alcohol dehydrogenase catalytic domain-containing protein [Acidomonas methanolica]|uniref:Alcohol dehydrogenase n=1 Tax=Acidomonas methanolica NBRC 104435 TaxID=1231351 RepID=A0A023D5S8_ACIMT|nr:alcohol dehydrogenase catalytic domain-containing protein [Acidomonas methanolica]MBU2653134.1 alcohol dehydrogenase catalytic domain-containing protein [Acidomonas methanolica]TCS32083.1 L-idonate 5-dehydrogenase [Acidomonas methanolica]GAJ29439.1 alcohol dehydrogenase [Acidomonas methanolica NBRC 104435]GBQ58254.1 threonine dehydrogenase [Acidomonas methanolica]GEK97516.1 L-idonate 5-dehydrogenase [Acidomonas methanolica NBRC 104435]